MNIARLFSVFFFIYSWRYSCCCCWNEILNRAVVGVAVRTSYAYEQYGAHLLHRPFQPITQIQVQSIQFLLVHKYCIIKPYVYWHISMCDFTAPITYCINQMATGEHFIVKSITCYWLNITFRFSITSKFLRRTTCVYETIIRKHTTETLRWRKSVRQR